MRAAAFLSASGTGSGYLLKSLKRVNREELGAIPGPWRDGVEGLGCDRS